MNVDEVTAEKAWLGTFVAVVTALVVGSIALPRLVYDRFIWQYFWGPVYSDAQDAVCAVKTDGGIELFGSGTACQAATDTGTVAYTGYTLVSEAGYMITLVFMLVGVLLLLERLQVAEDRELFFALVPFMLFGGALRVVEDASDAAPSGVDPAMTYPLNTLFISPIIYVTVFVVTLGALLAGMTLQRRGITGDYYRPVGVIGSVALALTVIYLFVLAFTVDYVTFYPQILVVDLVGASVIAYLIYVAIDRYEPEINAGTGAIGLVVLWGHAVDGVANVVAADWTNALGHPLTYSAKHPANQIIINITEAVLPANIATALGTSWPFLLVKMVVAVGIIWLFDERIFEESPRYTVLLLVAAVAVGLGPGTRDMLRVTFGI
jgi:uncharacterized membrane protein